MHSLMQDINALNAWLLTAFAFLSALDVWTTSQFPKYGIPEANKWLDRLMSLHGFDELYFVKYAFFVLVFVATHERLLSPAFLALMCVVQGAVVVWNFYQIARRANSR